MHSAIVPPYLLRQLATFNQVPHAAKAAAKRTLLHDREFVGLRHGEVPPPTSPPAGRPGMRPATSVVPKGPRRTVADAKGVETTPGTVVRKEGDPASSDVAVNEAYDGLGATYALYADVYQRDSIDGAGLPLNATVHYGKDYDNAFWDGEQMVFGDGDGEVLRW